MLLRAFAVSSVVQEVDVINHILSKYAAVLTQDELEFLRGELASWEWKIKERRSYLSRGRMTCTWRKVDPVRGRGAQGIESILQKSKDELHRLARATANSSSSGGSDGSDGSSSGGGNSSSGGGAAKSGSTAKVAHDLAGFLVQHLAEAVAAAAADATASPCHAAAEDEDDAAYDRSELESEVDDTGVYLFLWH
jgi:hypothetical protein